MEAGIQVVPSNFKEMLFQLKMIHFDHHAA